MCGSLKPENVHGHMIKIVNFTFGMLNMVKRTLIFVDLKPF